MVKFFSLLHFLPPFLTPTVSFVTLSAMPAIQPRLKHQHDIPTGRRALAGSMTRPVFYSRHCRVARNYVAIDTTARFGCGDSPSATHALLRRADHAHGFVGDTVAIPALLSRTMPQHDDPHRQVGQDKAFRSPIQKPSHSFYSSLYLGRRCRSLRWRGCL